MSFSSHNIFNIASSIGCWSLRLGLTASGIALCITSITSSKLFAATSCSRNAYSFISFSATFAPSLKLTIGVAEGEVKIPVHSEPSLSNPKFSSAKTVCSFSFTTSLRGVPSPGTTSVTDLYSDKRYVTITRFQKNPSILVCPNSTGFLWSSTSIITLIR